MSADFQSLHGFMGNMESWKMEDQSSGSKSLHDIVRKMKGLHTEIHNAWKCLQEALKYPTVLTECAWIYPYFWHGIMKNRRCGIIQKMKDWSQGSEILQWIVLKLKDL